MKKIEKLVAKIGYNTAKKTVNSASAWHSHQVKEPAAARASLLKPFRQVSDILVYAGTFPMYPDQSTPDP